MKTFLLPYGIAPLNYPHILTAAAGCICSRIFPFYAFKFLDTLRRINLGVSEKYGISEHNVLSLSIVIVEAAEDIKHEK